MSDALVAPVRTLVDAITDGLQGLGAGADADVLAATEVADLAAAFIDADGLHSDDELRAFVVAVGPLTGGQLMVASPADVRAAGLVSGRRALLDHPSRLFELLVAADARDGDTRSWAYYRAALDLGHAVAAIDVTTTQAELDAIARFRQALLERIRAEDVPRPDAAFFGGHPAAGPTTAGAQPVAEGPAPTAEPPEPPEAAEPAEPVEVVLAELDELIGLEPVKAEVRLVADLLTVQRLREQRGLKVAGSSRHLVFTGNPGTGKTTVARLLARIYRSLGVVARGHLVETDRSGLVAGYVGQTAERTRQVMESALDGVLLIDEAYALARGSEQDFGREAIDTVVKHMEDLRDRLVVIAAGYPEEMAVFMGANPGLASRFPKTIHFPDYTSPELVEIFVVIATGRHYEVGEDAREAVADALDAVPRDKGFGNGRLARNLFEAAMGRQASRIVGIDDPSDEQLVTLMAADIHAEDVSTHPTPTWATGT